MRIRPPFPAVVVFLALLGPHAAARAADDGGSLYGVNEKIHGKTYAEWTVAWFQWALGTRADRNPALDKTGAFAGEGQRGPVWFLGGNFGGATTRTFVLPAGKAIFSPVLYKLSTTSLTEQAKRDLDTARDMEVTLDGKSVGDLTKCRVVSPRFQVRAPGEGPAVVPEFVQSSALFADGYWFMLKPLPPGEHTLRIRGRLEGGFNVRITYRLKVKDG